MHYSVMSLLKAGECSASWFLISFGPSILHICYCESCDCFSVIARYIKRDHLPLYGSMQLWCQFVGQINVKHPFALHGRDARFMHYKSLKKTMILSKMTVREAMMLWGLATLTMILCIYHYTCIRQCFIYILKTHCHLCLSFFLNLIYASPSVSMVAFFLVYCLSFCIYLHSSCPLLTWSPSHCKACLFKQACNCSLVPQWCCQD